MENEDFEKDGGAKSRKLWLSVGTSILIILSSLIVPAPVFGEVVAGLITVCGIYVGGNAATKWIAARKKSGVIAAVTAEAPDLTKKRK